MFTENFKLKALEHSRIKNLQEFGLYLDECQTLFSRDSKYGVVYTELFIAILDLNKKTLISKHSNDKSAKISKLKLTYNNNITYMNKFSNHTDIIVSSIDFLGDYFQVTVSDDIIDYIYVEQCSYKRNKDSLFLISNRGDLYYYSQLELKRKTNIIADCGNMIRLSQLKEINMVEFVEDTNNLLIILSNGTIINYCLTDDPERVLENNNDSNKTIFFEEIVHLDASNPNQVFFDNLRNSQDNYSVTTFKILKFVFQLETFIVKKDDMEIDSESLIQNAPSVFVCVGYTKNKTDSYLCFYEILGNQITLINKILLQNKIIVDSYTFFSNNLSLKSSVPDYLILCCKLLDKNKIEILASDFLECLKIPQNREIAYEAKYQEGLFTKINEIQDVDNSIKKLSIIGVYITPNPDYPLNNPVNKSVVSKRNALNEERGIADNRSEFSILTNINELKTMSYSINLIIRELLNYNKFDAYLVDLNIQQISYKPSKDLTPYNELLKHAITSDVTKHLEFFKQNNSKEIKEKFQEKVAEIISSKNERFYSDFEKFLGTTNMGDKKKIDYYLLLLMYHNDLIPIKFYLSLKESSIGDKNNYILSNDELFYTVNNIFYSFLKNLFYEKLKDPKFDSKFFLSEIFLSNLQTALEILKISKNRNENPYAKPFTREKEIIIEGSLKIQSVIFDLENVLMIFKIIKSYVSKFPSQMEFENPINEMENIMNRRKQFRKGDKNKYLCFELITLNSLKENFPDLKKFYLKYFNDQLIQTVYDSPLNESNLHHLMLIQNQESTNSENISGYAYNELLYFTKFQFFFYYFYYVMDYNHIRNISEHGINSNFSNKNFQINSCCTFDEKFLKRNRIWFEELEEEFAEYSLISLIFYKLDHMLDLKENYEIYLNKKYPNIDITTITQFTIKFNKSEIYKTPYYKQILNKLPTSFNSALVNLLSQEGYTKEALSLSNSILTLVNDFDELKMQLMLLLKMNLINIAYQFVNNCFASLVCYSENYNFNESINEMGKSLLDTIVHSEEFLKMRSLYFDFFDFLMKNNHIPVIYTLPYNFIERHILKDFFLQNPQYEEFLLIYFVKLKKIKEAENSLNSFNKNSAYSHNLKEFYAKLLECLKFIYGENFNEREDLFKSIETVQREKLSYEVNAYLEKENYKKLGGDSFDNKKFNESAIVQDSIMDIDFIAYKPSDVSVNETIRNILMKKQSTAKKTFGLFTEVKPILKRREGENEIDVGGDISKYKSMTVQGKLNLDRTPIRREENSARKLNFGSNITIKSYGSGMGK